MVQEKRRGKSRKRKRGITLSQEILSWVQVLIAAIISAFFINNFIIANSIVPSGSMENTIQEGDRVIGLRTSYYLSSPERGDIAIIKFGWICRSCGMDGQGTEHPDVCPYCGKKMFFPKTLYYLKRVIGEPGDVITITKGEVIEKSEIEDLNIPGLPWIKEPEIYEAVVSINGEVLEEGYLKEPMLYTEDMEFQVPEGCYFFMGDNRNNSWDARFWEETYIKEDDIIAKVVLRYFPGISFLK